MTDGEEGGRGKRGALGKALRAMFRGFERRPVPQALRNVVDQLEDAAKPGEKAR